MKLVIIAGPSTTGKTTLARRLSKDLKIPAFIRDDYKEQEYDLLDKPPTLNQLAKIDRKSRQELRQAIKNAVEQDTSLIIESNFTYPEGRKIKALIKPNVVVVEIFCQASGITVLRRYVSRNKNGERHRGHRDHLWYLLVAAEAAGPIKLRYRPFNLSPNVLKVDTNNFASIDYETIHQFIINAHD